METISAQVAPIAKSKVSGLLFLALAWAVIAPAAQSERWSTYRNENSGYRIDYPAGWTARRFSIFGFNHTRITVAFIEDGKICEVSHAGSNPNDSDIDEHTTIYDRMQRSFTVLPAIEADLEGRIGREER